jgi:hypothetical protein
MRASLHAVATKPSFISTAHSLRRDMGHVSAPEPTTEAGADRYRRTRVSTGPNLSSEAGLVLRDAWQGRIPPGWRGGSRASRHMAAPELPPRQRGGVQSLGHMAVPEPSLSREAGFSTAVARGSVWMHTLPFVLARSMYMRVLGL